MRYSFINFCLDSTARISMVYKYTRSSLILRPADQQQILCSRHRLAPGLFTHPHSPTQEEKATTAWNVLFFLLQMRAAKKLSNIEQEPTHYMSCLLTFHLLKASHKAKYNIHEMGKYIPSMGIRGQVNIYFPVIPSIRVTFYRLSVLSKCCSIAHILKRCF